MVVFRVFRALCGVKLARFALISTQRAALVPGKGRKAVTQAFLVGCRFQRRALTQPVGRNDTSHDERLCRGCAARAFGIVNCLMGLLHVLALLLLVTFCKWPSGDFRPTRGFLSPGFVTTA